MVDNRLVITDAIFSSVLKRAGLHWYAKDNNLDYLANCFVKITKQELHNFQQAAISLNALGIRAAKEIAAQNRWKEAGVPKNAIELVRYSLKNEIGTHLINRFDFAGGINDLPIKLLEFNADTCSLMPETAIIQEEHYIQEGNKLKESPFNPIVLELTNQFKKIITLNPNKDKSILVSTMGHEEDKLNTEIIMKAATAAGFTQVQAMPMDKIIFAPNEGFYIELSYDNYRRYDYWFKFVPWELIAYEEPELMDILTSIVTNDLGIVLNPAFTMLLQSKAICKFMYDLEPENPYLLKTSFQQSDFPDWNFVKKPIFGRMGENIAYFNGAKKPAHETQGDYGNFPPVYQAIAEFNLDKDDYRYQPSIFFSGEPCGLGIRRQDELIIDDDADFVGHTII